MRTNSARRRILSAGGSDWSSRLLLGNGHGQASASPATATGQRLLPSAGLHALAESVRAQAALVVGLIGPFHGALLARWSMVVAGAAHKGGVDREQALLAGYRPAVKQRQQQQTFKRPRALRSATVAHMGGWWEEFLQAFRLAGQGSFLPLPTEEGLCYIPSRRKRADLLYSVRHRRSRFASGQPGGSVFVCSVHNMWVSLWIET